jgi:hypothetical protein
MWGIKEIVVVVFFIASLLNPGSGGITEEAFTLTHWTPYPMKASMLINLYRTSMFDFCYLHKMSSLP